MSEVLTDEANGRRVDGTLPAGEASGLSEGASHVVQSTMKSFAPRSV